MLNGIKNTALAGLVATLAVPAAAATFDFTDGNNGANVNYDGNYSAIVDGITVDVTAGLYNGLGPLPTDDTIIYSDCSGIFLCPRVITKTNNGLGVGGFLDGGDIDGSFGDDLITFSFGQVVNFSKVLFANVDRRDDFDLFVDGVLFAEEINIRSENPFLFSGVSGTSFSIGADAAGFGFFGDTDDFRIASIEVSAVPLPAGFALLLTGLGGLGLMRRRRSA